VREQIAVECRILREQAAQVELRLGGDELIEPDYPRRHLRPVRRAVVTMVRIRAAGAHCLEDHGLDFRRRRRQRASTRGRVGRTADSSAGRRAARAAVTAPATTRTFQCSPTSPAGTTSPLLDHSPKVAYPSPCDG